MASEEIAQTVQMATEVAPAPTPAVAAAPEKLDELEEINFLLEEIESKIAPLALA